MATPVALAAVAADRATSIQVRLTRSSQAVAAVAEAVITRAMAAVVAALAARVVAAQRLADPPVAWAAMVGLAALVDHPECLVPEFKAATGLVVLAVAVATTEAAIRAGPVAAALALASALMI